MSAGHVGDPAPAFDVPLVGGEVRGLADLIEPGGGILLFFKADCPTCRMIVPRLNPLARALAREGRLFLGVAQEDEGDARAFRAEGRLEFGIAFEGPPYAASRAFDVSIVPTLVLVDGAGIVAERVEGFSKREYAALGAGVEQALSLGDVPAILERPEELPEIKPG